MFLLYYHQSALIFTSQFICPEFNTMLQCQKCGHGKGQCKGKLKCFRCAEEDHEGFDCNNNPNLSNCGKPHMASSTDCQHFIREKEIQKVKSEKTLRGADSLVQRMIHHSKNHMLMSLSMFSIQLKLKQCLPGLKKTENHLGWLVNQKENNVTPSHKTSNSSQRVTTSVKTSIYSAGSTKQANVTSNTSIGQLSKGPPQGHGKLIKDPVQVHNTRP